MIGIYCPTLGRPDAPQKLVTSVAAATVFPHRVVFVVEDHDPVQFDAALATGCLTLVNDYEPSYSNSIQTAFEQLPSEYFIAANDDFDFQPGWDTEALAAMADGIDVVGVHDGSPGCRFTTISLVRRSYVLERSGVIDMPGRVFYPYRHNFADDEFHGTATAHGVFTAAPSSVVLHRHPDFGLAAEDATYQKSRAQFGADAATFGSRRHLWESLAT